MVIGDFNKEELIWQQKVRLDWLKYGDSNSKFYHALVKSTQRKKKIIAFRRDDGSWCTDPKELEEMVVNFYQNLYKDDGVRVPLPVSSNWSKILVDQLKPMLEGLIGRSQSSFIPGRQAVDNVIVVQEVIYTMKTMKRRERALALKVDLEKAYDRVKWSFIREVMTEIGIPSNWISLIMNIVQSPTFAIIWNGNSSTSFSPSRDDLMLFGVATSQQVMLKTLDKFCQASGQKKLHALSWKTICLSKELGRLQIMETKRFNLALLAKLGWQIWINKDPLWVDILKSKYLKNQDLLSVKAKTTDPYTWRSILKSREILVKGLGMIPNNGHSALFWMDSWQACGPLLKFANREISVVESALPVASYCNEYGNWDFHSLQHLFPARIIGMIAAIFLDPNSSVIDEKY
ncbi:Uncharacterized protein TCM_001101 [Theobroma cacao]|uniref:Reverse transcriptase domain-containing protein n=1 Tax=Theobroma cacao TaxID=3641 RepID=A0A061DQ70_THECC|nr:Uncharacterized protein TCM_001101 [Theobroma cacao]